MKSIIPFLKWFWHAFLIKSHFLSLTSILSWLFLFFDRIPKPKRDINYAKFFKNQIAVSSINLLSQNRIDKDKVKFTFNLLSRDQNLLGRDLLHQSRIYLVEIKYTISRSYLLNRDKI